MYSVLDLAKMYNTSKQTMYGKVKSDEMKPYIVNSEDGIKVDPMGLNVLNVLMANSKVKKNSSSSQDDSQDDSEPIHKHTGEVDQHLTEYINHLKGQIEDLKREKQELVYKYEKEKQEYQLRYDQLFNLFIERQKLLEPPKGLLAKLFKK